MENYEHWKELEQAINIAITSMRTEREVLNWKFEENEKRLKLLDKSIRELQRVIESSK
jgi:hypothetical protein